MRVDFYSTTAMPSSLKGEYLSIFEATLNQDNLIDGNACRDFEHNFSSYQEVPYVIGVGNGFDAIKIGLQALGVGVGDRVAVPAHTFIATWYAVLAIGAIPLGVDVTSDGQMNLDELEHLSDLRAVIPVHMHGTHCDMSRLTKWATANNVLVLEDCAQAAGLDIQGKKAGSWGDAAAFSFYPTKNLFTLGDGGAIATSNHKVYELAKSISRYGSKIGNKYEHVRLGQNSRLDTIHAAFLNINLEYLDSWNESRRRIADTYNLAFKPTELAPTSHVYHHYIIYIENRDSLRLNLQELGIATEVHYPNFAAGEVNQKNDSNFPVAKYLSKAGLSLPISPWQEIYETEYVIENVRKLLKSQSNAT